MRFSVEERWIWGPLVACHSPATGQPAIEAVRGEADEVTALFLGRECFPTYVYHKWLQRPLEIDTRCP